MFIFTVTPGLSGTMYLAERLKGTPDARVVHELAVRLPNSGQDSDPPTWHVLQHYQTGDLGPLWDWYERRRIPQMRRMMAKAKATHYIETNNLLCKAAMPALLKLLEGRVALIHLRRDAYDVTCSFLHADTIPGHLYSIPSAPTGLPSPYTGWPYGRTVCLPWRDDCDLSDDFVSCLWCWFEAEAKAVVLSAVCPVWLLELADASSDEALADLLRRCGLEPPTAFAAVNRSTNTKKAAWRRMDAPGREALQDAVAALRERLVPEALPLFDTLRDKAVSS